MAEKKPFEIVCNFVVRVFSFGLSNEVLSGAAVPWREILA
jgi:hypothetical protein